MCGRYAVTAAPEVLASLLGIAEPSLFDVRYNLAPTQEAPVARRGADGALQLDLLRWGLVPSWSKDAKIAGRTINARSETVGEKPSFRAAFRRRRCIVPASWFYEWERDGSRKVPHLIERQDGEPLTFAGLWESWKGNADTPGFESFTILTTAANETLEHLHDRMPVILADGEARERWLDVAHDDAPALELLFEPAPKELLRTRRVSTKVNSVRNEGPELLEDDSLFPG